MWKRAPEHDKRIERGDDFAGDAYRNAETGELRWVAVGRTACGRWQADPATGMPLNDDGSVFGSGDGWG
jgi:hypothetical protein